MNKNSQLANDMYIEIVKDYYADSILNGCVKNELTENYLSGKSNVLTNERIGILNGCPLMVSLFCKFPMYYYVSGLALFNECINKKVFVDINKIKISGDNICFTLSKHSAGKETKKEFFCLPITYGRIGVESNPNSPVFMRYEIMVNIVLSTKIKDQYAAMLLAAINHILKPIIWFDSAFYENP